MKKLLLLLFLPVLGFGQQNTNFQTQSMTTDPCAAKIIYSSGAINQTICEADLISPIVFELADGAQTANVTGLPTGITYNIDGTALTISGTPSDVAVNEVYSYSVQPINVNTNCSGTAITGTITVNADGELTSTSGNTDQTLCEGEAITPINLTLGGSATGVVVSLDSANSSVNVADISWINVAVSGTSVIITGTPGADINTTTEYAYTVTTTGNSCNPATPIEGTISVNPTPKVIYDVGSGSINLTICEADSISPIVFELADGAQTANVTGLPTGITYAISGTTLTISGTPSGVTANQDFAYTIQPVNDTTGCTGNSLGGTITVNADHELTSTSGNTDQVGCEGESIVPIKLTLAGGATGVVVSLDSANSSANVVDVSWMNVDVSGTSVTITGTPSADITTTTEYAYSVTTTGNSCRDMNLQGTIYVEPTLKVHYNNPDGTNGNVNQTVCEGVDIVPIEFTLEGTESANVTGLPTGITYNIVGKTLTISGTPSGITTNQDFDYIIEPLHYFGCTGNFFGGTIHVNAEGGLNFTTGNANQTIVEGQSITPIELSLSEATGVHLSSNSGAEMWMNLVVSGITITLTGTPFEDIDTQTVIDYGISTIGNACTNVSRSGFITVNPLNGDNSQNINNGDILLNGNVKVTKDDGLTLKSGQDDKCYRIKIIDSSIQLEETSCN